MTDKTEALLRLPQVLSIVPISRSKWYEGVKSGQYPQPIKIGPRISTWKASEVQSLLSRLVAGSAA